MNTENNNEIENNEIQLPNKIETPPSIGEYLQKKREEKGLSLKVISQQTKIHIGLLDALEKNQLTKLPSKTYVRGFVKAWSKVLGFNQEEALLILEESYSDKKEIKPTKLKPVIKEITPSKPMDGKASFENIKSISISYLKNGIKFSSIFLVIIIVIINLKNYIEKPNNESKLKLPVVLSTLNSRNKTPVKPKVLPAPKVEAQSAPPIQVNLIQDKKELTSKSEVVIKDVTMKTPTVVEKQFTIENSLSKEQLDEFLPSRFRVHPSKGLENVFINATTGDSWITYKTDDREIKKFVLRQGRTVFIRGEKIRLFLGNTKNVKVFYNNQLLAFPGKSGVKNVVFPDELKTKYMNPLFVFEKDGVVTTSEDYLKNNKLLPKVESEKPVAKKKEGNP